MRYSAIFIILFSVLSLKVKAQISQTTVFTREEILSNLDSLHPYKSLPAFDLETQNFVIARAHLYADRERWAIVLEEVKPGPGGDIVLYSFGNCLINQDGAVWTDNIYLTFPFIDLLVNQSSKEL